MDSLQAVNDIAVILGAVWALMVAAVGVGVCVILIIIFNFHNGVANGAEKLCILRENV
jgi:hypothetical protein